METFLLNGLKMNSEKTKHQPVMLGRENGLWHHPNHKKFAEKNSKNAKFDTKIKKIGNSLFIREKTLTIFG